MHRLLIVSMLLFFFTTGFIFTGCGDSKTTVLPVKTPTPGGTTKVPLPDPELKMVAEGEEGGLFSSVIDLITDGLKEGITVWIGDNTTGRILDGISNKIGIPGENSETVAQLNEMNEKMDLIISQLSNIENELDSLQKQLAITNVELKTYISSTALQSYITEIKARFDTTDDTGLMYFSQQGSALDPNIDPNSPVVINLQQLAGGYVKNYSGVLEKDIQGIHDSICPDLNTVDGVLKNYTDQIILTQSNPYLSDPNNAMATYCLLETFFAQILNYQTKGCVIVTEINNYKDPNGVANLAGSYLNGTYKTLLKDEIIKYQQTVNYLVLNMIDYRDPNSYHNEAPYMYTHGVAPDNVYLMVLARSRFFCAQVINALENDSGLYGAIVTPYHCSSDPNMASTQVTLQFSGPTTFTATVKAQKMASQFPYTVWKKGKDSNGYQGCYCDNNWSFYDFSTLQNPNISGTYLDPNIPAGTYNITLIDNGNEDTPWYHDISNTNLGQVSVKYYDPNNPSASTATFSPTATNTQKFGYFSARWNWGYNKISLCDSLDDWHIPGSNQVRWPGNSHTEKHDNPTIYPSKLDYASYFPKSTGNVIYLNYMGITLDTDNAGSQTAVMYTLHYPFIATQPSGTFLVQPSATVFYDTTADVDYSNSKPSTSDYSYDLLYFDYYLIDSDKGNTYTMFGYHSENDFNLEDTTIPASGAYNGTIVFGHTHDISIDAGSTTEENKYSGVSVEADVNLSWNIQVIYNGIYNIFQ